LSKNRIGSYRTMTRLVIPTLLLLALAVLSASCASGSGQTAQVEQRRGCPPKDLTVACLMAPSGALYRAQ
jgi:hypothetical protein